MPFDLPKFSKGEQLKASDLNLIVDALIKRIVQGPGIVVTQAGGQIIISKIPEVFSERGKTRMRVQSNHADYLTCRTLGAGGEIGTDDIYVLKPWTMTRTPFENKTVDGKSYTYSDNATREATVQPAGTPLETQQITQDYFAGAEIWVGEIDGNVLVTLDGGAGTAYVKLIDSNYDSRGWVRSA